MRARPISRLMYIVAALLLASCASQPRSTDSRVPIRESRDDDFGVLVMAHGGSQRWNDAILTNVAPLKERYNLEIAFGMADPATMQASVTQLEARGAKRIGVVRLFISGESFLERTAQILGVVPGAPPPPADASGAHTDHGYFSKPMPAAHCRALPEQLGETRRFTETVKIRAFAVLKSA